MVALAFWASWGADYPWSPLLATYLRALRAVMLQDGAWMGLLVAAGLLWHSRIAFSLSVLAFGACALYGFIAPDTTLRKITF